MRKFGLIGYPLSHSFSPGYFKEKFEKEQIKDARYDLYPLEAIEAFKEFILEPMAGLNVTIPYKESVVQYLDRLSVEAEQIGAVNVIAWEQGDLVGYNSDAYGFEKSLSALWSEGPIPEKALVLGTGGAAKAVWYVLDQLGLDFLKVSRSAGDIRYEDLDEALMADHHLIVNTTPLGMAPDVDRGPEIPYHAISSAHILYDLIYNPLKTLFLTKGEEQGAKIQNGLPMLQLQADRAWEIWNN